MELNNGVKYSLYNPAHVRIPLFAYDAQVKYVEMLDQDCVILPHQHNDGYEIYYCLSGEMRLNIGETQQLLRPGWFVLITPTTQHSTVYQPDVPVRFVSFHFSLIRGRSRSCKQHQDEPAEARFFERLLQLLPPGTAYLVKDQNNGQQVLSHMEQELLKRACGWELMLRGYYQEFLICLMRNLLKSADADGETRIHTNLNIPILLTKYMRENYRQNIRLQDLADQFYMTTRQVERVFDEYFHSNFKETLNAYRITHCKYYLANTSEPLDKISSMVGFSSAQTLIRAFKTSYGITPSQYRQQTQNAAERNQEQHISKSTNAEPQETPQKLI
ncbi:MAG: helix-turn-helix domain-containing protein [Clostridia bacterium]|nr:helix-turn-helix domain-containing protein [Clostridia bacterium]